MLARRFAIPLAVSATILAGCMANPGPPHPSETTGSGITTTETEDGTPSPSQTADVPPVCNGPGSHGPPYTAAQLDELTVVSDPGNELSDEDKREFFAAIAPRLLAYNATPYISTDATLTAVGEASGGTHEFWDFVFSGYRESEVLRDSYWWRLSKDSSNETRLGGPDPGLGAVPQDIFDKADSTVRQWNATERQIPKDYWLWYLAWGGPLGHCVKAKFYDRPPSGDSNSLDQTYFAFLDLETFAVVSVKKDCREAPSC